MQTPGALYGFTLIEALVGISIAAILVAVGVPTFNTLFQHYRVGASANEMHLFLNQARSEAIKRNANVYVSFITGDDWCIGMNVGSTCDCSAAGDCDLNVMQPASSSKVTLSIAGYTGSNFYYEGAHGMASTAGNITFTNYTSADFVRLTVGRMGSIKMCSTGIGGFTGC